MKSKRTAMSKGLSRQFEPRKQGQQGMARLTEESLLERIKHALRNNYEVVGACHVWTGPVHESGYGNIGLRRPKGVSNRAHRAMWQVFKGEIPEGLRVCHRCDNPLCVNLKHLWLGTSKENTQDMLKKGRGRWAR